MTPDTRIVLNRFLLLLAALLAAVAPAAAQSTTGTISGRITDQQGVPVPGVIVQAVSPETGFERTDVTDEAGTFRLAALPVGSYDVRADLTGFQRFEARGVTVNIARTVAMDIVLRIAALTEAVTVSAEVPLVSTRSSAIGQVVDVNRIENLPLNGRQFANLAATVPGVGLGFHSDVSKSAQYAPQISGGNGRNITYVVDGGDNTDDTVGGLLQGFPLEAIQEFDVLTQRFDAEYGRSGGAVINVVTRSGTNTLKGSWFTLVRDDAMNARTFNEQLRGAQKQPYERYQFGGSLGGPLVRDRAHYFAAYERTHQNTTQIIDTLGVFPEEDGRAFDVRFRENLFTAKLTFTPRPEHYLALRVARNDNSQPHGAGLRFAHSAWGTTTNDFNSVNLGHNWVIGTAALNEFVFQYSDYRNELPASDNLPTLLFLGGQIRGGSNANAPQATEQTKWQFRDDFSFTRSGAGLAHEIRAGVNWIHEPRLFAFTGQGINGIYQFLTPDVNGPIGNVFFTGGSNTANMPMDMYGVYVQDDWRVTERLTLNVGVRWDYVSGFPVHLEGSPNFQALQAAGRSGRFEGTLLEDFGQDARADKDNVQPRLGGAYDVFGDGRTIVRGGWGIYTDFAYTASNALVAALDGGGGAGIIFSATNPAGIRKADGSLFHYKDSRADIEHLNTVNPAVPPTSGEVVSPLLEQPFTYQSTIGIAREISRSTAVTADYVRVDARDLNMRVRPNVLVNGARYLAGIPIQPNSFQFRTAVSKGSARYDALILATRRRLSRGVDVNASYTLASATSDVGTAYDEVAQNLIQDITNPFADVQQGPSSRTDARHRVTLSAVLQAPFGFTVAPILMYHSALPVHTQEGIDRNSDGTNNEITALAYRYTGLTDAGVALYAEDGRCETVNCSRRAPFSQLNLRVSRSFRLPGSARIEAIAEVFNLFNAPNPVLPISTTRLTPSGAAQPTFMQPSAYAGDAGQPEQRVGQLGFRVTF